MCNLSQYVAKRERVCLILMSGRSEQLVKAFCLKVFKGSNNKTESTIATLGLSQIQRVLTWLLLMDMLETKATLLHTTHTEFTVCSNTVDSARTWRRVCRCRALLAVLLCTIVLISMLLLMRVLVAKVASFHAPFAWLAIDVSTKDAFARIFRLRRRRLIVTSTGILCLVLETESTMMDAPLARFSSRFTCSKDCRLRLTLGLRVTLLLFLSGATSRRSRRWRLLATTGSRRGVWWSRAFLAWLAGSVLITTLLIIRRIVTVSAVPLVARPGMLLVVRWAFRATSVGTTLRFPRGRVAIRVLMISTVSMITMGLMICTASIGRSPWSAAPRIWTWFVTTTRPRFLLGRAAWAPFILIRLATTIRFTRTSTILGSSLVAKSIELLII